MFFPPGERDAVGGPSSRFGLPGKALPLGLSLSPLTHEFPERQGSLMAKTTGFGV